MRSKVIKNKEHLIKAWNWNKKYYEHCTYNLFFPFHLFKPYTYTCTGTNYQVFWPNKHLVNVK